MIYGNSHLGASCSNITVVEVWIQWHCDPIYHQTANTASPLTSYHSAICESALIMLVWSYLWAKYWWKFWRNKKAEVLSSHPIDVGFSTGEEREGVLRQTYSLCDCIRKHSQSGVFGLLGAVLCCWEMWQPLPISAQSVENRCELSVSQHCGCGWCRSEPKRWSLLKYVREEGSQRLRGRTGSGMWQFLLTLFPDLSTGAIYTPSHSFISLISVSHLCQDRMLILSFHVIPQLCRALQNLKSPPWEVQHE